MIYLIIECKNLYNYITDDFKNINKLCACMRYTELKSQT